MSHEDTSDVKLQGANEESTYKTIERVTANPTAKAYIDTAVHLYEKAKESSPIVKSTLEMVESTTEKGIAMIPTSVLQTADAVGVVGLDKLAEGRERLETAYEHARETIGEKMTATDEYLKGVPIVSTSANTILNVGEAVTNRVFPEKEKEKQGDEKEVDDAREDGPLFRAGKLSYRVTESTLAALRSLSLKDYPAQGTKSVHLAIDLLADAALTMEATARSLTSSATTAVSSRIPTREEINQSFQAGTSDIIGRLTAALQMLAENPTVVNATSKVTELQPVAAVMDTEFYKSNAEKLREASKTLADHVEKGDVPAFVFESVTTVVTNVRDSLTQKAAQAQETAKNDSQ
eukprot:TRINITY_DN2534_c0_g1_i1.p1 TRINITY_DN2534_c0_g1~~TRINITY_DN2534_c0_g1_i1.p1  ORF type:complete len:349 (-),score=124.02 TRINITY_DN2534_c0_g1_i1:165-1211(-)